MTPPLEPQEYPYYRPWRGQKSIQSGWDSVRGNTRYWLGNEDLAIIEGLSTKVDIFGEAWFSYQAKRQDIISSVDRNKAWLSAMKMLEASQLGCLDAVRAVSMIGRPSAAQALIRTMFETFLNILILSIDGQINASEVTAEGCTENEQNDSLAKRFIGHAHHSLLCNMERFEEIWGSEVAEGDEEPLNESDVRLLRTLGEDARKQFGFGTYDFYWYPFKSIWAIKNYLWPKNGTPTFDTQAVPISNSAWDHYFELCYTFAGHYNHGGPASVLTHFQDGPNRTWKPVCLDDALDLADYSLATIAVALNCYDIYRSELKARGLVDIS